MKHQSKETTAAVADSLEFGESLTLGFIATQHGIHLATLKRALRRAGIAPRRAGRPRFTTVPDLKDN